MVAKFLILALCGVSAGIYADGKSVEIQRVKIADYKTGQSRPAKSADSSVLSAIESELEKDNTGQFRTRFVNQLTVKDNFVCLCAPQGFKLATMTSSPEETTKQAFGRELRKVVDERGLRQKALASKIDITEAALSKILNGKARPRQVTLSRLLQHIQATPEEQQRLLAAYDHAEFSMLPVKPSSPEQPTPLEEIERVKRYMEMKSVAVTFQEDVAKALDGTNLFYEQSFRQENIICDFFLPGPPRIAVDCKYNLNRDWDRTVTSVRLLKEHLDLESVLIVVPYENDITLTESDRITEHGGMIVSVADLEASLRLLTMVPGGET